MEVAQNRDIRRLVLVLSILIPMIFLLFLVPADSSEKVFFTELTVYSNGSADLEELEVTNGSPTAPRGIGEYEMPHSDRHLEIKEEWREQHYLVVRNNDTIVASQPVSFRFFDWDNYAEDAKIVEAEQIHSRLEYHPDAEYIELVRGQEEVLFSAHIPSNMCKDDGKCSVYCKERNLDSNCGVYEKQYSLLLLISIIFILVVGILYISIKRTGNR